MHLGRLVLSKENEQKKVFFHVEPNVNAIPARAAPPRTKVTVTAMLSRRRLCAHVHRISHPALIRLRQARHLRPSRAARRVFARLPVYGVVRWPLSEEPALRRAAAPRPPRRREAVQLPHGVGVRLLPPALSTGATKSRRGAAFGAVGTLLMAVLSRSRRNYFVVYPPRRCAITCRSRPSSGCTRPSVPRSMVCSMSARVSICPSHFFKKRLSTCCCAFDLQAALPLLHK